VDITQALRDAENSLRDFIELTLSAKLGDSWIEKCGASPDRLRHWRERKVVEEKRQRGGVVEQRLIYYADFFDLRAILKANWNGPFSDAFGDLKNFEMYLAELEKLRDPDAHRRELLPHQKHLAIGISGEIRGRIVRYRSKRETTDDVFPRIENVRDSLGNVSGSSPHGDPEIVQTKMTLRPGDQLDFVITASDPEDLALEYGIEVHYETRIWQQRNTFAVRVVDQHIGKMFAIHFYIRSPRTYHARGDHDDEVIFFYSVLPASRSRAQAQAPTSS
jgi:hypothetical protein